VNLEQKLETLMSLAADDREGTPGSAVPTLLQHVALEGLPEPVLEHRFHATRRWRFDVAWPAHRFAVEVDGGVYVAGRHSRGAGIEGDCEKYAHALIDGWRVLRITPRHVKNGKALQWVKACLLRYA